MIPQQRERAEVLRKWSTSIFDHCVTCSRKESAIKLSESDFYSRPENDRRKKPVGVNRKGFHKGGAKNDHKQIKP